VIVIAESFLGVDGRAIPFEDLRRELERIAYKVDHRQLETVIGEPATAERLALWFRDQFSRRPLTVRVEVGDGGWVETE
jgi:hypothetical protein